MIYKVYLKCLRSQDILSPSPHSPTYVAPPPIRRTRNTKQNSTPVFANPNFAPVAEYMCVSSLTHSHFHSRHHLFLHSGYIDLPTSVPSQSHSADLAHDVHSPQRKRPLYFHQTETPALHCIFSNFRCQFMRQLRQTAAGQGSTANAATMSG